MPRIEQNKSSRGSQKWLQILVNHQPELLTSQLRPQLRLGAREYIHWLSPLENDQYAEYQDDEFIKKLDVNLGKRPLQSFWPKGGPVWDGLGVTDRGELLLVEAKAHIGELISSPSKASPPSMKKIYRSLEETKQFLASSSQIDWTSSFYQYTNRLAHLYLLRQLNELPAYLIFLYFINATDVKGPNTREEWKGAIILLHSFLRVVKHKLSKYIIDVFIDVSKLKGP
jgi:hypothetical protein